MFGMQTLYEISEEKYRELTRRHSMPEPTLPASESTLPELDVRQSHEFALEAVSKPLKDSVQAG